MTIIKRTQANSSTDLVSSLDRFSMLLRDQHEDAAADDLDEARKTLVSASVGSEEHQKAINTIIDAFEGDHELIAYTLHKGGENWTEAEELAHVSSRVLNLARRMRT